jgi:anaphase-promoting complex subunit 8
LNPRDFRAWYGLGQAYEVLRMNDYSLYYYKRASWIQPYDVRLYVAMGVAYESLHQQSNARNCYERACRLGDPENMALYRLAK